MTNETDALLVKAEELIRQEAAFTEQLKGATHARIAAENVLAERIHDGNSTGDDAKDASLWKWATIEPEQVGRYRAINELLQGQSGQLVLSYHEEEFPPMEVHNVMSTIYAQREHQIIFHHYRVGILEGDSLLQVTSADKGLFLRHAYKDCSLPVKNFVCLKDLSGSGSGPELENTTTGGILEGLYIFRPWEDSEVGVLPTCNVMVGDEAVKEWFKERGYEELFSKVLERLGRLTLTSPK